VPGAFFAVHFAAAMPQTRSPAAQDRVAAIINEAKATGLVQKAIEKAGLKGVRTAF
jgi:polar amino acid transport system substrate-binding protein